MLAARKLALFGWVALSGCQCGPNSLVLMEGRDAGGRPSATDGSVASDAGAGDAGVSGGGCVADENCGGATPKCDLATRQCVGCTDAAGCTAPLTCSPSTNQCEARCTRNADCASGTICDVPRGLCVPASCTSEFGCAGWTTGPWGACGGASCGRPGSRSRMVACVDGNGAISTACEGTPPAAMESCFDDSTCTYDWSAGAFGSCSSSCGTGQRARLVSCMRSDGVTMPDRFCNASTRPAPIEQCSDETGCTFRWEVDAWNACAASCGSSVQVRNRRCVRSDGAAASDSQCPSPAPDTMQGCQSTATCTYAWATGGFGSCSTTCGTGTQTQTVSCRRSDGVDVAASFCGGTAPPDSQSCHVCSGCSTSSSLTMIMDVGDLADPGIDVFRVVVQLGSVSLLANDNASNIAATTFSALAPVVQLAFHGTDSNVDVTSLTNGLVVTDQLGRTFATTLLGGTYVAVTATNASTHWIITARPSQTQCLATP